MMDGSSRSVVAALLWLPAVLLAGSALAAPPVVAVAEGVAVHAGSVILDLEGGEVARLQGVLVPQGHARTAQAAMAELLPESSPLRLARAAGGPDRYGRLPAQVERADGLWLQGVLLERGLALVALAPGATERVEAMRALERQARARGLGFWGDGGGPVVVAAAAGGMIGRFAVVHGQVLRVAQTSRHLYLNFGVDWWRDFTLRIRLSELDEGFDRFEVEGLAGRRVEARGFVLDAGGPLIELSHPEQIEVLP
jgi:micrococcal nuclease